MAGQSIFCRAYALFNNGSKIFLTNRVNHVNLAPTYKLKHDASDLEKFNIPERPKKPLTAFFNFMVERRPILIKQNPSLSTKDIVRNLADEWKSLNSAAKVKFQEQAKQNKVIYDKKILEYRGNLTPAQQDIIDEISKEKSEDRQRRRYRKELRDEHKPKKPATSFGLFMSVNVNKGKKGEKSLGEFMNELKEQWAKLPDAEKNKYKLEYEKNKQQYDKELDAWETKMIAQGKEQLVRTSTLKAKHSQEKRVKKGLKSE